MIRVGLYTGKIYHGIDAEECCWTFTSEEEAKKCAETTFFPYYKCHNCNGCPESQK